MLQFSDFSSVISIGIALNIALQFDWSSQSIRAAKLQHEQIIRRLETTANNIIALQTPLTQAEEQGKMDRFLSHIDFLISESEQSLYTTSRALKVIQISVSFPLIIGLLLSMWYITFYPTTLIEPSWTLPLKILVPLACFVIPLLFPLILLGIAWLMSKILQKDISSSLMDNFGHL